MYTYLLLQSKVSISNISEATDISRRKVEKAIISLERVGLVVPRAKYDQYVTPYPPSKILALLEFQSDLHRKTISQFEKELPAYLYEMPHSAKVCSVYSGRQEFISLFHKILEEAQGCIYHIGNEEQFISFVGKEYFDVWIQTRIKKGITACDITFHFEGEEGYIEQSSTEFREMSFLPDEFRFNDSFLMWNNSVAFFDHETPHIILVNQPRFAKAMKQLYHIIVHTQTSTST